MSRSETSMRLATVVLRVVRSATGLGGEETADQAGDDVQRHHQDDEYEGRRPGPVDRELGRETRLGELVEREDRQRAHPAGERVEVRAVDEPGGDEERCRLA